MGISFKCEIVNGEGGKYAAKNKAPSTRTSLIIYVFISKIGQKLLANSLIQNITINYFGSSAKYLY